MLNKSDWHHLMNYLFYPKTILSLFFLLCIIPLNTSCQNQSENNILFNDQAQAYLISHEPDSISIQRDWVTFKDTSQNITISTFIFYPVLAADTAQIDVLPSHEWQVRHFNAVKSKIGAIPANSLAKSKYNGGKGGKLADGLYPVLIFGPGLGWLPSDYMEIISTLVKKGIIVITVATPPISKEITFLDGSTRSLTKVEADYHFMAKCLSFSAQEILTLAKDTSHFLYNKIDTQRVFVGGHSVSGASSLMAASRNPAIRGIINLDGDVNDQFDTIKPNQPILYVTSQPENVEEYPISAWAQERNEKRRDAFFSTNSSSSQYTVRIKVAGMKHSDFLDAAMIKDQISKDIRVKRFGNIAPKKSYQIITQALITFIKSDFDNPSEWDNFKEQHKNVSIQTTLN